MNEIGHGAAIFAPAGLKLSADESAFFRDYDPFGYILFARNIDSPGQVLALTESLRSNVGRKAPILIDQESGRVQRLRAPYWREWAPPLDSVASYGSIPLAARAMAIRMQIIAAELRAVGIDANCAPLADVPSPRTHPFLRNRCYGTTPESVTLISRAVAGGLLQGGVLPVLKHLPGHGRAMQDSHEELPRVDTAHDELSIADFLPFKALRDLPMAMTAHIVYSAIDPTRPATQSPEIIRLIREEIGFAGLLMTDDLMMKALSGDLAERTERSIRAGCDLALHCSGDLAEMTAIASAAGNMGKKACDRATAALAQRVTPPTVDIAALEAMLADLSRGAVP